MTSSASTDSRLELSDEIEILEEKSFKHTNTAQLSKLNSSIDSELKYDRQVRTFGFDTQCALSTSQYTLVGESFALVEVFKNLLLLGALDIRVTQKVVDRIRIIVPDYLEINEKAKVTVLDEKKIGKSVSDSETIRENIQKSTSTGKGLLKEKELLEKQFVRSFEVVQLNDQCFGVCVKCRTFWAETFAFAEYFDKLTSNKIENEINKIDSEKTKRLHVDKEQEDNLRLLLENSEHKCKAVQSSKVELDCLLGAILTQEIIKNLSGQDFVSKFELNL